LGGRRKRGRGRGSLHPSCSILREKGLSISQTCGRLREEEKRNEKPVRFFGRGGQKKGFGLKGGELKPAHHGEDTDRLWRVQSRHRWT